MDIKNIHWHDNFIIVSNDQIQIIGFLTSSFPEILKVIFWSNPISEYYIDINNNYVNGSNIMSKNEKRIFNNTIKNINLEKLFKDKYRYFNEYFKDNPEAKDLYKNKI